MKASSLGARWLLAMIGAAVLSGGAYAFADSLTVTSDPLSAGSTNLPAACSPSARTSYLTNFDPSLSQDDITMVVVRSQSPLTASSPAACSGHIVQVELTGSTAVYPVSLHTAVFDPQGIALLAVPSGVPASALSDVHVVYDPNGGPSPITVVIDSSPTGKGVTLTANASGGTPSYRWLWTEIPPGPNSQPIYAPSSTNVLALAQAPAPGTIIAANAQDQNFLTGFASVKF